MIDENEWRSTDLCFDFYWLSSSSFPVTQWVPCGQSPFHRTMRRKFTFCPLKHIEQGWGLKSIDFPRSPLDEVWRVTTRCRRPPPKPYTTRKSFLRFSPGDGQVLSAYDSQTQQSTAALTSQQQSAQHKTKQCAHRRWRKTSKATEVTHLRPERPQSTDAGVFLFI